MAAQRIYPTPGMMRPITDFGAVEGGSIDTPLNTALLNNVPVYIPDGIWNADQILVPAGGGHIRLAPKAELRKVSTSPSGWGSAFITNAPGVSTVKVGRFRLDGTGTISTVAGASGSMISVYGDDQVYHDFTLNEWENGLAWLIAGDRIRMHGVRALAPRPAFNPATGLIDYLSSGGIRFAAGSDFACAHAHIVSGDDAFQAVPLQAAFTHPFKNQSINGVRYSDCTGRSIEARLIAAVISDKTSGSPGMTCDVRDVVFRGVRGQGGGRGIAIRNEAPSTGGLYDIKVKDCMLDQQNAVLGTATNDILVARETGTGPVERILFEDVEVRNPKGKAFRTDALSAEPITGLRMVRGVYPASAAQAQAIEISGCQAPILQDVTTVGVGTTNAIILGLSTTRQTTDAHLIRNQHLGIPTTGAWTVINLNDAPRTRIVSPRLVGGSAGTAGKVLRTTATSIGLLVDGYDLSGWASSGTPFDTALAPDARVWKLGAELFEKAAWSSTATYIPGDIVLSAGARWYCQTGNLNSAPTIINVNWVHLGQYGVIAASDPGGGVMWYHTV